MTDTLRSRTLHGLFWSFFERIGQQGIQFAIQIILARLLLPEQFGLIAMLTIFMAVAQSFLDSGFGSALIQKQDATHVDESSIFYFNIAVGLLAAGLLYLTSSWIAAFYNVPLLATLTRVLSLNIVINSFGLVQTALLTKRVDFKTQLKISLFAVSISGGIGVGMAYNGFGVWSLVVQSLSSNIFRTLLLWLFNTWRPLFTFSFKSLKTMFAFGSKLLASGLLDTLYNNMYLVVIGKIFSPTDLGFYSRAKMMEQIPVSNITSSVERVTYPIYSAVQDDKPRMKRGMKKSLMMTAMVNFPLMIGLAVVAKSLVSVLLTDRWAPCVQYFQLMCIIGLLYPLHVINLNVLKAQRRSDLFFRLEVLKKSVAILTLFITFRWGIIAMLYGQFVASTLAYYLNSYYTGKLIKYPMSEQVIDVFPMLGLAVVMGVGVYSIGLLPLGGQVLQLGVQFMVGIVFYGILCYHFKHSLVTEAIEIVRIY